MVVKFIDPMAFGPPESLYEPPIPAKAGSAGGESKEAEVTVESVSDQLDKLVSQLSVTPAVLVKDTGKPGPTHVNVDYEYDFAAQKHNLKVALPPITTFVSFPAHEVAYQGTDLTDLAKAVADEVCSQVHEAVTEAMIQATSGSMPVAKGKFN